uniref:Uncharacterized protein LOC8258498 n=1 Tax=Rhizophora mucronata TaxID=61149 RepID=A0A2P2INP2_RHIMU
MALSDKMSSKQPKITLVAMADAVSWCCALVLVTLVLLSSLTKDASPREGDKFEEIIVKGKQILDRPCDEIYVVQEGETLHTISDKCGDPFIVEENPHIHDPDDVFPGLVIKITSPLRTPRKSLP